MRDTWARAFADGREAALMDWAAGLGQEAPFIHFELDAAGSGTVSGIHCKIEGWPALAEGFFQAAGQPHRTEAFVRTVQSLPRGWYCRYTGVFPGRTTDNTRMEVEVFDKDLRRSLSDPEYLQQCFDELGFAAYDDAMLRDVARLAAVDVPISMQFDLLPDGSFLPIFSILSLYEHIRPDCGPLFAPDGGLTRTCQLYEEMGISDGRWRMMEQAIFTDRQALLTEKGLEGWARHCLPCCTKAKWISAERTPAKFYLLLDAMRAF